MKSCCIVHFLPLEKYLPVGNFLRYIASCNPHNVLIHVLSIHPGAGKELVHIENVEIHRLIRWSDNISHRQRTILYLRFNLLCFLYLLKHKPGSVLYYETLSAGGPVLYKRRYPRHCCLFIHYHEYVSKNEYRKGMVLNQLGEKNLAFYGDAKWSSRNPFSSFIRAAYKRRSLYDEEYKSAIATGAGVFNLLRQQNI